MPRTDGGSRGSIYGMFMYTVHGKWYVVHGTWYMVNGTWLLSQSIFDGSSRVRLFSVSVGNFVYLISFDNTIYITDIGIAGAHVLPPHVGSIFIFTCLAAVVLVYIAYFIGGRRQIYLPPLPICLNYDLQSHRSYIDLRNTYNICIKQFCICFSSWAWAFYEPIKRRARTAKRSQIVYKLVL